MVGALIPTVITVFRAVVTIFLTGLPGFVAGYAGAIDQTFLQPLSRFLLGFLTPALMFSTLSTRLTLGMLGQLWPLVLWSSVQMIVAVTLSSLLARVVGIGVPGHEGPDVFSHLLQMAVCFQNIGTFNFPLLQTLCNTPGMFDREGQRCFDDGVLMIFIYKMPWDVLLWTWGYSRLMAARRTRSKACHDDGAGDSGSAEEGEAAGASASGKVAPKAAAESKPAPSGAERQGLLSALGRAAASCNPILAALILGAAVGLTPGLRALLVGPDALLGPLRDAARGLGTPVPGMGLQVLSGTLGCTLREFQEAARDGGGKEESLPTSRRWLTAAVAGKLVLLPALGFIAFANLSRLGACPAGDAAVLCPSAAAGAAGPEVLGLSSAVLGLLERLWPQDRLVRATLLMQWSAPSFVSLMVICHKAALDKVIIQSVALLYLAMYAGTIVTSTFWVGVGLAVL